MKNEDFTIYKHYVILFNDDELHQSIDYLYSWAKYRLREDGIAFIPTSKNHEIVFKPGYKKDGLEKTPTVGINIYISGVKKEIE